MAYTGFQYRQQHSVKAYIGPEDIQYYSKYSVKVSEVCEPLQQMSLYNTLVVIAGKSAQCRSQLRGIAAKCEWSWIRYSILEKIASQPRQSLSQRSVIVLLGAEYIQYISYSASQLSSDWGYQYRQVLQVQRRVVSKLSSLIAYGGQWVL